MDFEYICDYRIVSVHTLTFHRRQAACPRERAGVAREASSCNAFAIATFSSCYFNAYCKIHYYSLWYCYWKLLPFFVACQQWTLQPNTSYAVGQGNGAVTVQQCQAACLADRECNGFDWAPAERVGQQCWLSGRWSGRRGTSIGITHYVLNRNCGGNKFENFLPLWNQSCKVHKKE